jgi:hypothetical protein
MPFTSKWIDLQIKIEKNITFDKHLYELIKNGKTNIFTQLCLE